MPPSAALDHAIVDRSPGAASPMPSPADHVPVEALRAVRIGGHQLVPDEAAMGCAHSSFASPAAAHRYVGHDRLLSLGWRAFRRRRSRALGGVDDRPEAAPEHALAVERHVAFRLHVSSAIIFSQPSSRVCLVRPFDQGEDDLLALLGLHRPLEVGDLAFGHVVAPGLDHADRAMFLEDLRRLRGHVVIGFLLALGHRQDEAVDIAAAPSLPSSTNGSKPPKIMRLPSNGMLAPISSMRGSLIIFSLAASRVALSGYSNQEKTTLSSSLA